jgi:Ca2+-binding RTX toxin-like protein
MPVFFTGTPVNGSSDNDILIGFSGNPNNTFYAGDGDDVIYGDYGDFFATPSTGISTAYNITDPTFANYWTRQENRDIANSTTVSHASFIPPFIGGGQSWFYVTVAAGATITLDVDYGRDANNLNTDTELLLYDVTGTTVLQRNDDAALDVGSTSIRDSSLTYTFATAGTYLINIRELAEGGSENFETNDEFMLHISLTGQAFAADPAGGSDYILGGNGNDTLYGFAGEDNLNGGQGGDVLNGGAGFDFADYLGATSGVYARLDGYAGASGEAAGDTFISIEGLRGSAYGDFLVGSSANNDIYGEDGDDTLYGFGGDDLVAGENGNDRLYGGDGVDFLAGGAGNDNLYGGAGADQLLGGIDTDLARYDEAATGVYARLDGVNGAYGEAVGDTFFDIEGLVGSYYGDTLVGNNTNADLLYGLGGADALYGLGGNDTLDGGTGNDTLYGGAGGDVLNGGTEFDLARYDSATFGIYARLDGVAGSYGDAAGDVFIGIEGIVGSYYNDTIVGNNGTADYLFGLGGADELYSLGGNDTLDGGAGSDRLYGGAGNDTIIGGDGDDRIIGESGNDTLYGNAGSDRFSFENAPNASTNVDTIMDFNAATDRIDLSGYVFNIGNIEFGTSANESSDSIIYNQTTGQLFYDADGNGSIAQILFATVTAGTVLTVDNFSFYL